MKNLNLFVSFLLLFLNSNINFCSQLSSMSTSKNSDNEISVSKSSNNSNTTTRLIAGAIAHNKINNSPTAQDFSYEYVNFIDLETMGYNQDNTGTSKQAPLIDLIDAVHLNEDKIFEKKLSEINNFLEEDDFGYTVFDYIVMHRNEPLAELLYNHINQSMLPFSSETILLAETTLDVIKLKNSGSNITHTTLDLNKLLIESVKKNNRPLCTLLCELGANPYGIIGYKQTAFNATYEY